MKKLQTMVMGALGLSVSIASSQAALIEWKASTGGNGHFYEPVLTSGGSITWHAAKASAEAKGGYLATLTSSAENNFVFSLLTPDYWIHTINYVTDTRSVMAGPFIGAYQMDGSPEPAGGWVWLNNEGALSSTFSSWANGLPDNGPDPFGNQNVGHFLNWGTTVTVPEWNDVAINNPGVNSYVIEYNSVVPVPEPSTYLAGLSALGMLGMAAWRSRK